MFSALSDVTGPFPLPRRRRSRLAGAAVALLACVGVAGSPAAAQDAARHATRSVIVGSFASELGARLDADGTLDTGAGVLELLTGADGAPLVPAAPPGFGTTPLLWASYAAEAGGLPCEVRVAGPVYSRSGDVRLRTLTLITVHNPGSEPAEVVLGARLSAGTRPPEERPRPCPPLTAETRFTREGDLILRDGLVLLAWSGHEPDVLLHEAPADPRTEIARLTWKLALASGRSAVIELSLAGFPSTDTVDEAALRPAMLRQDWRLVQEALDWSANYAARFKGLHATSPELRQVLAGGVWFLRLMGRADQTVHHFGDRPWGHPASDFAVQAEQAAVFAEWGFGDWAFTYLNKLPDRALAEGPALPPERRLQLAAGLVRGARLIENLQIEPTIRARGLGRVADVVTALLTEPAAVAPWQDPAVLRQDLETLFRELGRDPSGLPELRWAEVAEGGFAAALQAARRAISARDGTGAWQALRPWIEACSVEGLLPDDPGGLSPAEMTLGLLSVLREALVDDHGPQLVLLPALHESLVPGDRRLSLPLLPTRFGPIICEVWYGAGRRGQFGFKLAPRLLPEVETVAVVTPAGRQPRDVIAVTVGTVELLPDGTMIHTLDKGLPTSWGLRLVPEPGS